MKKNELTISDILATKENEPLLDCFNNQLLKQPTIKSIFHKESENYNNYSYKEKVFLFNDMCNNLLRKSDTLDKMGTEFPDRDFERMVLYSHQLAEQVRQLDLHFLRKYNDTDEEKADTWMSTSWVIDELLYYMTHFQIRFNHQFSAIKDGLTTEQWTRKWQKRGEGIYNLAEEKGLTIISTVVHLDEYVTDRCHAPSSSSDVKGAPDLDISDKDRKANRLFNQCRLWHFAGSPSDAEQKFTDSEIEKILNNEEEIEEWYRSLSIKLHAREALSRYY